MVNDGEVLVYERGICQNLHFDHRWYIFPSLISYDDLLCKTADVADSMDASAVWKKGVAAKTSRVAPPTSAFSTQSCNYLDEGKYLNQ